MRDEIQYDSGNSPKELAEEFSEPGTLKRFLLSRGFMPDNKEVAEAILDRIIKEWEERDED